jgi:hypothetical protein
MAKGVLDIYLFHDFWPGESNLAPIWRFVPPQSGIN